jgi:hypothetical protein
MVKNTIRFQVDFSGFYMWVGNGAVEQELQGPCVFTDVPGELSATRKSSRCWLTAISNGEVGLSEPIRADDNKSV